MKLTLPAHGDEDCLYFYNEPLLFIASFGDKPCLVMKIDEMDLTSSYLAAEITNAELERLVDHEDNPELRPMFECGNRLLLIETDYDMEVVTAGVIELDDNLRALLPDAGCCLRPQPSQIV